jgi:hypothetical protein
MLTTLRVLSAMGLSFVIQYARMPGATGQASMI